MFAGSVGGREDDTKARAYPKQLFESMRAALADGMDCGKDRPSLPADHGFAVQIPDLLALFLQACKVC
jgi:hypothetical protein